MMTCRCYHLPEHAVCAFTTMVTDPRPGPLRLPNGVTITFDEANDDELRGVPDAPIWEWPATFEDA